MWRRFGCIALGLSFMLALRPAVAGDDKGLSVVPSDAVLFVYLPSIQQADTNFQQTITNLGLDIFVQPPFNSLSGLMGNFLGMTKGLNVEGPLAVAMMPFTTPYEVATKQYVIVPSTEPKALLEAMGGTETEGGNWSVNVMGQLLSAAIGKDRVVIGMIPDTAKQLAAADSGIGAKLNEAEKNFIEGMDLAIWVNGAKLIEVFRPQIDGLLDMMSTMQAGQGPAEAADATRKELTKMVDGVRSAAVGLSLGKEGLKLRFGLTTKPGSEFAKQTQALTTTESLLSGLPAGKYLFAAGQIIHPEALKEAVKSMDIYTDMLKGVEGVKDEEAESLVGSLTDLVADMRGMRIALEAVAPGADGLFAVSAVIQTVDSERWMKGWGKLIDGAKGLSIEDEDFKMAMDHLTYKADAEDVAGAKVSHLSFDVFEIAKSENADEEELNAMTKVLGKDGLKLRMSAVDGHQVAVCMGGRQQMAGLIESTRSGQNGLDNDAGIKKVSAHLPKDRSFVLFADFENILELVKNIAAALDEEIPPISLPDINAPVGIVAAGGKDWGSFEILVPTELMVASKHVAMMMMGAAAAQAQPAHEGTH